MVLVERGEQLSILGRVSQPVLLVVDTGLCSKYIRVLVTASP